MNELARAVAESGLEALLEHIHAVIVLIDADGRLLAWNSAFNPIKANLPDSDKLEEHIPAEERDGLLRRLRVVHEIESPTKWWVDFLTDADGTQICYDCLLLPASEGGALFIGDRISTDPAISKVVDKLNRQVRMFRIDSEHAKKLVLNKHAEVEAVIAQANEVSNLDALTFLPNRRQVIRELQDEVQRAQRYSSLLSISMLDVDHFKLVNDTYGHAVGDQVLREIAMQLRDHIRHPDMVARYGGEEFLILLPNSTKEAASEQAARLCKRVRDAIIHVDDHDIHVTLSIGVAQFQHGVDNWQTLLGRADTALYEAKNAGRDQWAISKT
jgi:diguanylate cyclase (GGDEF)-like protein